MVHLLLFDGDCGLCNRVVQAVLASDHRGQFHFASLQGEPGRAELARRGVDAPGLDTFIVIPDYDRPAAHVLTRSQAALFVASTLGWPWKALGAVGVMPTSWLDRAYDLVARNRHRAFSGEVQCVVPRPDERARFLDAVPPAARAVATGSDSARPTRS